jgi:hypothetical protein
VDAQAAELKQPRDALAESHRLLLEKEKQADAADKHLEIQRKELSSVAEFNHKRSFWRAGSVQVRNLF